MKRREMFLGVAPINDEYTPYEAGCWLASCLGYFIGLGLLEPDITPWEPTHKQVLACLPQLAHIAISVHMHGLQA